MVQKKGSAGGAPTCPPRKPKKPTETPQDGSKMLPEGVQRGVLRGSGAPATAMMGTVEAKLGQVWAMQRPSWGQVEPS